jgi:uncharacterized protein YhaN
MRLTSLTLHRYGNYESDRISFSARPGVVNILWAPNSAGKSVLRNAVADLLYGIHDRTPMDFRFGYAGMRIAANIVLTNGEEMAFRRHKARGRPLTDEADNPIDPAFLHAILGGRDRALLERLFVLDTEALRAGGRALLESGGDVASALLSAAGGIREARALKQRLEKQRDDLAPTRKTGSRPFYQALDRFTGARARTRDALVRPDEWFRRQKELDALEASQRERNQEAEQRSATIARLERIRRVRPWLAQLAAAEAWLTDHPDAPRFAPDTRATLDNARQTAASAEAMAVAAEQKRARAEAELAAQVLDDQLFALADAIDALRDSAVTARKAAVDLPGLRASLAETTARLASLAETLGTDQFVLPPRPLVVRTRRLRDEYTKLAASAATAAAEFQHRSTERESAREAAELSSDTRDVRALEDLLTEIRANGDPLRALDKAAEALEAAALGVASSLARVPGWSGGAEALAALRPPGIDQWRRLDDDRTSATRDAEDARIRLREAVQARDQAQRDLAALAGGEPVPDENALAAARAHRDAGWRLIFRRAFTADPPSPSEEAAFAGEAPLPLAFERAQLTADGIADRRARESDLLARIRVARDAVTAADQQVAAAEQRARLAEERLSQTRRAWEQICAPLALPADARLSEAQAFLDARLGVLDAMDRHGKELAVHTALQHRHADWAGRLSTLLDHDGGGLPALLVLADRAIDAARLATAEQTERERARTQAERELARAKAANDQAVQALTVWRENWRAVLKDLGRPPDEDPAETDAVLELLEQAADARREADDITRAIDVMTTDVQRFEASVAAVISSLPGRDPPTDPFDAARALTHRLTAERDRRTRHRVLSEAEENARAEAEAAATTHRAARDQLRVLLDLIGVETIETAYPRLLLSDERARFEGEKAQAEARLREAGDGLPVDVLRADAAASPVDEDLVRIEAEKAAQTAASAAAQQAAAEASALRLTLSNMMDDTAINDAAADQQAAVATIASTLDEALLYHAASLLLERALASVEKSGDSAMLRRISTIFNALTGGAHDRVVTDQDDDGTARLRLVQSRHPDERQSIDQLSEGARDQLFLALRVAAIEDHLGSASPLPFVGDDILQTFDDDRALAALRVLAGLSQHTQVIVLTHHRHVLDLAMSLGEGIVYPCPRESLLTPA